jgi:hypothetical protein
LFDSRVLGTEGKTMAEAAKAEAVKSVEIEEMKQGQCRDTCRDNI